MTNLLQQQNYLKVGPPAFDLEKHLLEKSRFLGAKSDVEPLTSIR